jgi:hypothetical protein
VDTVRSTYRELNDLEKCDILFIKEAGQKFLNTLDLVCVTGTREGSLAKTKIEEAVMWAVKGITG